MKEYNYSDIVRIDKTGILFSDAEFVRFETCKNEWAKENNISSEGTVCVAARFEEGTEKHYVFYAKERVKLYFKFKGLLGKKKSRTKFSEMHAVLNRYGYTSYDLS